MTMACFVVVVVYRGQKVGSQSWTIVAELRAYTGQRRHFFFLFRVLYVPKRLFKMKMNELSLYICSQPNGKKLHGNEHTPTKQPNKTWLQITKLDRSLFSNVFTLDISSTMYSHALHANIEQNKRKKNSQRTTATASSKLRIQKHKSITNTLYGLCIAPCRAKLQCNSPCNNAHFHVSICVWFQFSAKNMYDIKSRFRLNNIPWRILSFYFLHTFLFVSLSPHAIYLVCFLSIFLGCCFFLLHVLFNRWKAAFCIHFTILLVQCSFHMLHSSRNFYKHLWIYSSNILNSLNHF